MFRGCTSSGVNTLSRNAKRLAVVAQRTRGRKNQRATYANAQRGLEAAQSRTRKHTRRVHHPASAMSVMPSQMAAEAESIRTDQDEWVREESGRQSHQRRFNGDSARENKQWSDAAHTTGSSHGHGHSGRYDDVDNATGDSKVQAYFDTLVHDAVLRFGPPLPAEFVADNRVVAQTSSPHRGQHVSPPGSSSSWKDEGADGTLFHMYDAVALSTSELLTAIRRLEPTFSFNTHCDGMPFALLIKNCPYLRAFGGKVNAMRYLKREPDNRILVSLAKYKMREVASQDGIRQGPQPWLYGGRM